jgi:hypothetical protein
MFPIRRNALILKLHDWTKGYVILSKWTVSKAREIVFPLDEIGLCCPDADHGKMEVCDILIRCHWAKFVRLLNLLI